MKSSQSFPALWSVDYGVFVNSQHSNDPVWHCTSRLREKCDEQVRQMEAESHRALVVAQVTKLFDSMSPQVS
jgi:hypothetical protein